MKEEILRGYLENKVTMDILAADLKDSQKRTSFDVISIFVDFIKDSGEFEITRSHLIKLCDDTITGHLTTTDLNTIASVLMASDYFTWEEGKEDGVIIDQTIFDWDNPGIGFPLSLDNLKRWKKYLETGAYDFNRNNLKCQP